MVKKGKEPAWQDSVRALGSNRPTRNGNVKCKMRSLVVCVSSLTVSFIATSCSVKSNGPDVPIPISFNESSDKLKATEVVPTLNTPIPNGKNAIWCASFQSAWKALENDLAGERIALEGSPEIAKSLSDSTDPRPHIPQASLYVATGWNQQGIVDQIRKDFQHRFPNRQPPSFRGITPDSFVAYSYLEANVKFSLPYDQNPRSLAFTEGGGRKVEINSFGILAENHAGIRDKLWDEPRVLFRKGEPREDSFEFAIDLCSNSFPSQIIVARIVREPTLAAAVARVEKEIAGMPELIEAEGARSGRYQAERLHKIESIDGLRVPDFHWAISHRFTQVEAKAFVNQKLKGQRLDIAQQDILFRLDRSGAALKSEAKGYAAGIPTDFFFDRPFLVYMKKRDAEMPYFAMWVDNAELLRVWQGTETTRQVNQPLKQ